MKIDMYRLTWANKYPLVFVIALWQFVVESLKFKMATASVSAASSFYSACGYAVREKKGIKKILLIAVGGSGAVFFAVLALICKSVFTIFLEKSVWAYFEPTELDVLGSIFTQAKIFKLAFKCYWSIRKDGHHWVEDITICLTSIWYAKQPCLSVDDVNALRRKVTSLIHAHPEWDNTFLVRLWAFVGEEEKEKQARIQLAREFH